MSTVLKRENLIVPLRLKERLPRLIIDQDDVLAMFLEGLLEEYNEKHHTSYTLEDVTQWKMAKILGNDIWDIINRKGFFYGLKPVPYAIETFERMHKSGKYDMYICTASLPESYTEKLAWIQKYMPFFPEERFIACKSKDAVWGDILFDDAAHNIESYAGIGEALVFDRAHNRHLTEHKRIYNWLEFERYVEQKFY